MSPAFSLGVPFNWTGLPGLRYCRARASQGRALIMEDDLRAQRMVRSVENGLPKVHRPVQCSACVHRHAGTIACDAFNRIPTAILEDEFDHRNAYPGDSGVRWEAESVD